MAAFSIGTAWEEASAFLSRESRLVTPVALAMLAIPAAVQGWLNPAAEQGGKFPIIGLSLLCVAMAGQMAIAQLAIGWSGSIGDVLTRAFRRLLPVLGAFMLVYVPLGLVAFIMLMVSIGPEHMSALNTMTIEPLAQFRGAALTLLVVVVVALYLSVRLLPLIAVGMSESVGVFAMVKQAWALTRGHFAKLLALILLLAVGSILLSGAVTVVVGALAVLLLGPASAGSLPALLLGLANGLVSALVTTVYAALVGRIYAQLSAGRTTAA